jgi:hypothetical protein
MGGSPLTLPLGGSHYLYNLSKPYKSIKRIYKGNKKDIGKNKNPEN